MDLFDRRGRSAAWLEGDLVFDARGRPVAFVTGDEVRSYATGTVIGWWVKGWLRDLSGRCLACGDGATDGPDKPTVMTVPPRRVSQLLPPRPKPKGEAKRPPFNPVWSGFEIEAWMERGRE